MILQDIFYILAIIFMLSGIILVTFIGVLVWKVYQGIQKTQQTVREKVTMLTEGTKSGIMGLVGKGAAAFVASRIKDMFGRNRE